MPANDTTPVRTESEELDLETAARSAYLPACQRLGLGHALKSSHLEVAMLDVVSLHARGGRPDELLMPGLALLDVARTLTSGHQDEREVARIALHNDLADDHFRGIVGIEGKSATVLEEWAAALRRTNASNEALARILCREARQMRLNRATAQQRLGIGRTA